MREERGERKEERREERGDRKWESGKGFGEGSRRDPGGALGDGV